MKGDSTIPEKLPEKNTRTDLSPDDLAEFWMIFQYTVTSSTHIWRALLGLLLSSDLSVQLLDLWPLQFGLLPLMKTQEFVRICPYSGHILSFPRLPHWIPSTHTLYYMPSPLVFILWRVYSLILNDLVMVREEDSLLNCDSTFRSALIRRFNSIRLTTICLI